ncbi:MAG: hypothetical protein ACRDS9_08175 [Pseudonocardiaceae bacterium]
MYGRELAGLLEEIRAGEVPTLVVDQMTAERWLVRLAGALMRLQERHQVDERGRCSVCRPIPGKWWRRPPTRTTCTELEFPLPDSSFLPAISSHIWPVGARVRRDRDGVRPEPRLCRGPVSAADHYLAGQVRTEADRLGTCLPDQAPGG